jgi:hypothetical protein
MGVTAAGGAAHDRDADQKDGVITPSSDRAKV